MTLGYTTELTQLQWELLEYLLPPAKKTGRPRTVDMLSVIQAILYRSGDRMRLAITAQELSALLDGLLLLSAMAG